MTLGGPSTKGLSNGVSQWGDRVDEGCRFGGSWPSVGTEPVSGVSLWTRRQAQLSLQSWGSGPTCLCGEFGSPVCGDNSKEKQKCDFFI